MVRALAVIQRIVESFVLYTVLCSCAGLLSGTANSPVSQEKLKTLSLEQLGNVEVTTVSKEPEEVWKTPAAVYVLTQEDIRRSGVTNVADALRLVPGVNVERVNGARNWAVGIRGFGDQFSKYVLVLIDGRSVYTPLFGGVLWTINNVMLEDIDRIEVIRGPGGTIWGTNAVNGIINIITKSSRDTRGDLASGGGGNVDEGTGALRHGGGARGVNYRLYGFGFKRAPEFHLDGQPAYDWSRLGQVGARADWNNPHDQVTLQGDAYLGKFGDAQRISTFSPPASFISYAPTDALGGNLLVRWRRDFSNGSDIYLQAFWALDHRIGSNFGETRNTFDVDFLHRTPPTRFQQFTYGVGLRLSPSSVKQVQPADAFLPLDQTDQIYSGFLQDELRLLPGKLSLSLGTKLEHDTYTGFEYQPSARLLITPTERTTIWAFLCRARPRPCRRRHQGRCFLALPNPLIYGELIGNHDLNSERLVAYEAGFRALLGSKLYIDFAGFHNQYHDLIAQGPGVPLAASFPPFPPDTALLIQFKYLNGIRVIQTVVRLPRTGGLLRGGRSRRHTPICTFIWGISQVFQTL